MHFVTPSEALDIQKAAVALRDIHDRCMNASYDVPMPWDIEDMSWSESGKKIREANLRIRQNAVIATAASMALDVLFEALNHANSHDCDSARQALQNWHVRVWDGPQFSLAAEKEADDDR